jgi:TRAP-type C4-dicarboxylate transport system substrate-binding protein
MKRGLLWTLAGIFFVSFILGLSAPAVAQKAITLRLSSFVPPMHFMNKVIFEPWIEMIDNRTNGKLKIKVYAGGALGKPQAQYDMAVRGVADITWGILAYTPGRFPLTTVMELPFMSPSPEVGSRIVWRLYEQGLLKSEFDDVKLLALAMPPGMDLHTSKRLVKSLEDMKGMKIRTPSPMMGKLIKKWGAVPVAMPATEVYLSLDRGVIDAIFIDPLTLMGIRCNEVTKYHTRVGISATVVFLAMNKKTWDRLPPDIQNVVDELTGEWWTADYHGKIATKAVVGTLKKLEKAEHTIYSLPPKEMQRWEESAAPTFDEWMQSMEAKGLPGIKVVKEALRLKSELTK